MTFLTEEILSGNNWRALERAVARLMSHCGWRDVAVVGETGDGGADVVGTRNENGKHVTYVVQVKAVSGAEYVGRDAIEEVLAAAHSYGADRAVVATNGEFRRSAYDWSTELRQQGFDVRLWNGLFLEKLLAAWPEAHGAQRQARDYQTEVIDAVVAGQAAGRTQMYFVLATGLGKSVVAASILTKLAERGLRRSLVLCHMQDLALQLERSFWPQLPKSLATRVFFEGVPPVPCDGVNFGLFQSLVARMAAIDANAFDIVVVDEAHHAPSRTFNSILQELRPKVLVGMTATPWRGDGRTLDNVFSHCVARLGLLDGMKRGYLAAVDYTVYCDNIQWAEIGALTGGRMSIRDLNKRLFLPQRDEAIAEAIEKAVSRLPDPKIVVFCSSIEHSERFARVLAAHGMPTANLSGIPRVERYNQLMRFSAGKLRALTAVDVLNEGIDVPEVNAVIFLRCTHSRRIFLQQLGRGLRITEKKNRVLVMDFVADLRRLADVADLDRESRRPRSDLKELVLPGPSVRFSDPKVLPFVERWLEDVADIGEMDDSALLTVPAFE